MKLVLVTRRGCHLCDQALETLRALGHDPELADVDADDRLNDLYDWRVPVVLLDGKVVAEGRIDRNALELSLKAAGGSTKSGDSALGREKGRRHPSPPQDALDNER